MSTTYIEEALTQRIKRDCQCNFNQSGFQNSTAECRSNSELVYMTTLEHTSDDGSETASVIAGRIVREVPFSMVVGGALLTVMTSCSECDPEIIVTSEEESPITVAGGVGLFFGGFVTAALIAIVLVIIL